MKLQEILIVSDLDGTLVEDGKISQRNIDAIRRFRAAGGEFTIATGRSPEQSKHYIRLLEIEGAMVCNNGATLYHCTKQKPVWFTALPPDYPEMLHRIMRQFPDMGVCLIDAEDRYHLARDHVILDRFAEYCFLDKASFIPDSIPAENCCKAMLVGSNSDILALYQYLKEQAPAFDFVIARDDLIDLGPKGVDKGTPLRPLAESYGRPFSGVVTVGDYYNDIGMLKSAPLGVAVGNALDEVKQAADWIVASCSEDAIADLIDRLMEESDLD